MKVALCFVLILIVRVNAYHLDKEISRNNRTQRIVNGEDPEIALYFVRITGFELTNARQTGSGSLITRRHVLTLAGLIKGCSYWHIGYGSNTLNKLINITSVFGFIHPLYNENSNNDNIGIIILSTDLTSDLVAPISLPETLTLLPRDNEEGTIIGFETKSSNTSLAFDAPLKSAYLSALPENKCSLDMESAFCAANDLYDANVCSTDLGAAFTVHHRGEVLLAGMLIRLEPFCSKGSVSYYLQVQDYVPWIKAVTNM